MKKKFTGKYKYKLKVVNQTPTKLTLRLRLRDKSSKKLSISKIVEWYTKLKDEKYDIKT